MRKRIIYLLAFIFLIFILPQSVSNILIEDSTIKADRTPPSNITPLKQVFEYTNHSAIYIQGNYELNLYASLENWNGDGSQSNPYVISGYKFDNQNPNIPPTTQPLLLMKDIGYHCLITNNLFLNSNESSIHLENVSSIRIIENKISKCNNHGIIVEESNSVLITNNTIYQNNGNGILFNSSENSLITSNMIFDNMGNGTAQIDSKNITINNNSIFNNNDNGIAPISSEDILISDNTIFNNNISGIMTDHSNNVSICENNVHDTTNYEGIVLFSTENSSIFKNSVYL
jgi:parallel beta-helix repeat protein